MADTGGVGSYLGGPGNTWSRKVHHVGQFLISTEFQRRGRVEAFILGLAYRLFSAGLFSASCTFGFAAPILAIITVRQKVATGILFIILFAIGHCMPILVEGSSTAAVKNILENSRWRKAGNWFRKGAGVVICGLGVYFIVNLFLAS